MSWLTSADNLTENQRKGPVFWPSVLNATSWKHLCGEATFHSDLLKPFSSSFVPSMVPSACSCRWNPCRLYSFVTIPFSWGSVGTESTERRKWEVSSSNTQVCLLKYDSCLRQKSFPDGHKHKIWIWIEFGKNDKKKKNEIHRLVRWLSVPSRSPPFSAPQLRIHIWNQDAKPQLPESEL